MRLVDVMDGGFNRQMEATSLAECQITGITCDSRQVQPGYLFAAIPGTQADGRAFIPDAIRRGAAVILAPPGTELDDASATVPLIAADNPRRQYALMAARFFADQPKTIACVTGTNGKTSVATFLRQIWSFERYRCASAGTLGVVLGGFSGGGEPKLEHAINLTTPDPADLHCSLAELAAHGVDRLALEASSHGLSQYRLDGVRIAAAAYTNLTRDHLDYHGGMEGYLGAKLRLFTEIISDGGTAVVNADALYAEAFTSAARARGLRLMTFGTAGDDVTLHGLALDDMAQELDLEVLGKRQKVRLALPGAFQVANALAALSLAIATDSDPAEAIAALAHLEGVPGRVHHAGTHAHGAEIYVDYAHTPDALKSILQALRPHTQGRLHVVFGCGGDRDPGKRFEMGVFAARDADVVIVTDDNPRSEDPATIRAQAMGGCPEAVEIGNRREAIFHAIDGLAAGDTLVIAGKGHETGQIIGDEIKPFDDIEVVRNALQGGGK